jgi:hypothetical protein
VLILFLIQLVQEALSLGVKWLELEGNHSSSSSTEVKNACMYISPHPHSSFWRGA